VQVLKAVRGGVQDVAAKLIRVASQSDMDKFVEVHAQLAPLFDGAQSQCKAKRHGSEVF
jgi:hypothetical protein